MHIFFQFSLCSKMHRILTSRHSLPNDQNQTELSRMLMLDSGGGRDLRTTGEMRWGLSDTRADST